VKIRCVAGAAMMSHPAMSAADEAAPSGDLVVALADAAGSGKSVASG
jgi:hypothetical protein